MGEVARPPFRPEAVRDGVIMLRRMALVLGCAALAALPRSVTAQPAGGPFGPGFGPANRLGDVQKRFGASDEEWKVVGPKLQKVIAAREAYAAGRAVHDPRAAHRPPGRLL